MNIINAVKTSKGKIGKKILIIAGTVVGLAIVGSLVKKKPDEPEDIIELEDEGEDSE